MTQRKERLFVAAAFATLHGGLGCSAPKRDLGREAQAGNTSGYSGGNSGGSTGNGEAEAPGGEGGDSGLSAGARSGETQGGGAGANTGSRGSTHTGGSRGTAGALDTCQGDWECDDGKACNGVERCTNNVCKPGAAPCSNADPINCLVTCAEGAAGPTCSTPVGVDADHDGYKTTACASNQVTTATIT